MKPTTDVTAIVVTWNSREEIASCLQALQQSKGVSLSIIVVDNASSDGTVPYVRDAFPEVTVIQEPSNLGFAQANNEGIRRADSPFVLLCNPDVVVDPHCIRTLVDACHASPTAGAAGPLLYRTDTLDAPLPTTTVDSTGFLLRRRRSVEDRGAGRPPADVPVRTEQVFGVTAACALYRRAALVDASAVGGAPFDPTFGSYKEEVDLAWRLQLFGWDALFVPSAAAWHRRTVRANVGHRVIPMRSKRSRRERLMSYRNHFSTLWKNESLAGIFHPRVLWYEWRKAVYALFFEPYTLLAVPVILWKLPRLLRQRRAISRHRRRQPRDLGKWLT